MTCLNSQLVRLLTELIAVTYGLSTTSLSEYGVNAPHLHAMGPIMDDYGKTPVFFFWKTHAVMTVEGLNN